MEKSIYSEEYMLFLYFLQETRKAAGMTQSDVAARLGVGVTQSFVSKCERGERRVDIVELRAFCRAVDVPFDEFVTELEMRLRSLVGTSGAQELYGHPLRDGHQDGNGDGHRDGHDRIIELLRSDMR